MKAEDIIKKHAEDWNNWHEKCRKQVLAAMEEYKNESKYEKQN